MKNSIIRMSKPYLSIVVVVRNDDYGGDFLERLQNFISWNTALINDLQINTELILVNWNPIPNKTSVKEAIDWPENNKYIHCRFIEVPQQVHQRYHKPDIRNHNEVYEFIAKNYGIRRAKGEFILSTNADVLIQKQIFHFISQQKLNKTYYYRANRLDFSGKVTLNKKSDFYKEAVMISFKGIRFDLKAKQFSHFKYLLYNWYASIFVNYHLAKFQLQKLLPFKINVIYNNAEFHCHCNNSGDFMLMHRDFWQQLQGYPENSVSTLHADALFTVGAYKLLKEFIFNDPIFHQEHPRRFDRKEMDVDASMKKLYLDFQDKAQQILNSKKWGNFNDDSWGNHPEAQQYIVEYEC